MRDRNELCQYKKAIGPPDLSGLIVACRQIYLELSPLHGCCRSTSRISSMPPQYSCRTVCTEKPKSCHIVFGRPPLTRVSRGLLLHGLAMIRCRLTDPSILGCMLLVANRETANLSQEWLLHGSAAYLNQKTKDTDTSELPGQFPSPIKGAIWTCRSSQDQREHHRIVSAQLIMAPFKSFFLAITTLAACVTAWPTFGFGPQERDELELVKRQGRIATQYWANEKASLTWNSGAAGAYSVNWSNPSGGNFVVGKGYMGQRM